MPGCGPDPVRECRRGRRPDCIPRGAQRTDRPRQVGLGGRRYRARVLKNSCLRFAFRHRWWTGRKFGIRLIGGDLGWGGHFRFLLCVSKIKKAAWRAMRAKQPFFDFRVAGERRRSGRAARFAETAILRKRLRELSKNNGKIFFESLSVTVFRPKLKRRGWDSFSARILILRREGGAAERVALERVRLRGAAFATGDRPYPTFEGRMQARRVRSGMAAAALSRMRRDRRHRPRPALATGARPAARCGPHPARFVQRLLAHYHRAVARVHSARGL